MSCVVSKLHSSLKDFPPRGGASTVEVNKKILAFGGADREQTHFQDLLVYSGDNGSHFNKVKATGDVPMPRSGHAVVAYGKFMLLFGGIDFAEEAVFNDLYILDTDTFEWGYVGESGLEVTARNSHSLGIVGGGSHKQYLVIYGGASPEHGPLGDTIYSELPDYTALDVNTFHVTWQLLQPPAPVAEPAQTVFTKVTASESSNIDLQRPGSREMHGTCSFGGSMFISGGRNVEGQILSDVWSLSVAAEISPPPLCHSAATAPSAADMVEPSKEAATTATIVSSAPVLVWRRCVELELPTPRCAHGAAIVTCDIDAFASEVPDPTTMKEPAEAEAVTAENQTTVPSNVSTTAVSSMLLIGGFTGAGISGDAIVHPLLCSTTAITSQPAPVSAQWNVLKLSMHIAGRFGLAVCALSASAVGNLATNKKYAPVFSNKAKDNFVKIISRTVGAGESDENAAVFLFGGVCIEQDFGDIYLLTL